MDQTNPLSRNHPHKRRLFPALGPGGAFARARRIPKCATFTRPHYGRILPDRNAGRSEHPRLISSLSCYARINEFGFIESPYRKVKGGRVIDYVLIVNAGESEFKSRRNHRAR